MIKSLDTRAMVDNIMKNWWAYPGIAWDISMEKFAASLNLSNVYPEVARVHHTYSKCKRVSITHYLVYLSLTTDVTSQALYFDNMKLASSLNTTFGDLEEYMEGGYEKQVLSWFRVIESAGISDNQNSTPIHDLNEALTVEGKKLVFYYFIKVPYDQSNLYDSFGSLFHLSYSKVASVFSSLNLLDSTS